MTAMIDAIVMILRNAGPTVAELIYRLALEVVSSDDPERTAKRLLKQASIEVATEEGLRKAYSKGKGR